MVWMRLRIGQATINCFYLLTLHIFSNFAPGVTLAFFHTNNTIMKPLELISKSLESYLKVKLCDSSLSVVANYSDEQSLPIKSYHKATVTVAMVSIRNGNAYTTPVLSVSENYNHGTTSEEEAKDSILKMLLIRILEMVDNKDI